MKRIVLLAVLLMMILSPRYARSQDSLQPQELRQILVQLHELKSARAENAALKEYIAHDAEFDARERELTDQHLTFAGEKTMLATQTAALQKERADFYETLYRAAARKPSVGCRIARAVTLGIYQCR